MVVSLHAEGDTGVSNNGALRAGRAAPRTPGRDGAHLMRVLLSGVPPSGGLALPPAEYGA